MNIQEQYFGYVWRALVNKDIVAQLVLDASLSIATDSKTIQQAANNVTDYRNFLKRAKKSIMDAHGIDKGLTNG